MKFFLRYVAGFIIFSGCLIGLAVTSGWPWWWTAIGVVAILLATVLKFAWDVSGFNGGYSS